MANRKEKFVYLLVLKNRNKFKVGYAEDIEVRARDVAYIEDVDFENSYRIINERAFRRLEKSLHYIFDAWKVEGEKKDGCTEWFDYNYFESALIIIKKILELRVHRDVRLIKGFDISLDLQREISFILSRDDYETQKRRSVNKMKDSLRLAKHSYKEEAWIEFIKSQKIKFRYINRVSKILGGKIKSYCHKNGITYFSVSKKGFSKLKIDFLETFSLETAPESINHLFNICKDDEGKIMVLFSTDLGSSYINPIDEGFNSPLLYEYLKEEVEEFHYFSRNIIARLPENHQLLEIADRRLSEFSALGLENLSINR